MIVNRKGDNTENNDKTEKTIVSEKGDEELEERKKREKFEKELEEKKMMEYRARTNVFVRAIRNIKNRNPVWTKREMDAALLLVRGLYSAIMGIIFGYFGLSTALAWTVFTVGFVCIPLYIFPAALGLKISKLYKSQSDIITTNIFKIYFIFCLAFVITKIIKLQH